MLNIERNNNRHFDELVELLRGKNVYIQTHNFPDPDAIGTAYGLQSLLRHYGIPSKICYVGKIDRLNTRKMIDLLDIEIYSKEELGDEMTEDDPIICVDSQKSEGNLYDLIGDEIACIDHHPWTTEYHYEFVDHRMFGACATIIVDYYLDNEPENCFVAEKTLEDGTRRVVGYILCAAECEVLERVQKETAAECAFFVHWLFFFPTAKVRESLKKTNCFYVGVTVILRDRQGVGYG